MVASLLFVACIDLGGDVKYDGFELNFSNSVGENLDAVLYIGNYENLIFNPTDSILITNIPIGRTFPLPNFFDNNRWKPDLNKIRDIPSLECYFKIKLSDGRNEMLTEFDSLKLFSLKLSEKNSIRGNNGVLFISVNNEDTWANANIGD